MGFPKLDELNKFSPKLCRAMAVHNGKLFTQQELVLRSGFSKDKIIRLSKLDKWDSIPMGQAFGFAAACGLRLHRLRADIYHRMRWTRKAILTANANQRKLLGRLLSPT